MMMLYAVLVLGWYYGNALPCLPGRSLARVVIEPMRPPLRQFYFFLSSFHFHIFSCHFFLSPFRSSATLLSST